jgi:hypothetical protein
MLRTCSIARRYVQRGPKEIVLVLAAGEEQCGWRCEGEVVELGQGLERAESAGSEGRGLNCERDR